MSDIEYTNTPSLPSDAPSLRTCLLTFTEDERQILVMALGELLGSVRRGEHLIARIQRLLDRVQNAQPGE